MLGVGNLHVEIYAGEYAVQERLSLPGVDRIDSLYRDSAIGRLPVFGVIRCVEFDAHSLFESDEMINPSRERSRS